jgi:hypothetical protein
MGVVGGVRLAAIIFLVGELGAVVVHLTTEGDVLVLFGRRSFNSALADAHVSRG